MTDSESTQRSQPNPKTRFSFGIANLLMLIALVAVAAGWWVDHNQSKNQPTPSQQYDIPGPLFVSYKIRTSPSSTSGSSIGNVMGINYRGDNIIVVTESGGMVFNNNNLIEFVWRLE